MIAIDCRSLQDASKFRGIGTVIRSLIEHLPNKQRYALLVEQGKGAFESFGMKTIEFKLMGMGQNYGPQLADFLRKNNIQQLHFMAQYNVPKQFDFPFSVTVHDLFNEYFMSANL